MDEQRHPEIDTLVAAFYDAFDNRGSRIPAVEAMRDLFGDAATITRVAGEQAVTWNPEEFIAPRVAMLTDGTLAEFHEWETDSRTVVLENIASRWSTYEKEGRLSGADYCGGGQKFIQLHKQGQRWLISSILWEDS